MGVSLHYSLTSRKKRKKSQLLEVFIYVQLMSVKIREKIDINPTFIFHFIQDVCRIMQALAYNERIRSNWTGFVPSIHFYQLIFECTYICVYYIYVRVCYIKPNS